MNNCIIYAHPNPLSFNAAIKQQVIKRIESQQQDYTVIDLYSEDFNPVLSAHDFTALQSGAALPDVNKYQEIIASAEHLIFIYPIWWFGQPALLKGWIDRVFSHGFAYLDDENGFTPLLTGKKASLFVTMGSSKAILEQYGMLGFMDSMIVGTLNLVGITDVNYQPFYSLPILTDDERHHLLEGVSI